MSNRRKKEDAGKTEDEPTGPQWVPGEREMCYNLSTDDPIIGLVDGCSMFVNLSYRRLREFNLKQYARSNLLTITHLHLQNNKISRLPETLFHDLKALMHFDARYNELTTIPLSLKNHEGLETILLQDNMIEIFPIELGSIGGLKTLGIEYNPMQFPSHTTFRQWRNKTDVVDFFKRCWEARSTNVPAIIKAKIKKPLKPKKPKFIKVLDHSEIVCNLKRSNDLKKRQTGRQIQLQLQAKLHDLQKVKDANVLKEWQDKYGKYKHLERVVVMNPPPYGIDDRYKKITGKLEAMKIDAQKREAVKYRLNLNDEITGIKEKLESVRGRTKFKDPEGEMAARLNEIKVIKKLQKKIETLKTRL